MLYEWDNVKAKLNLAKHGVSFEEALSVFNDEFALLIYDEEHSGDEERFLLLGKSLANNLLLVVHVYKEKHVIRIISARKATKNESKEYLGKKA